MNGFFARLSFTHPAALLLALIAATLCRCASPSNEQPTPKSRQDGTREIHEGKRQDNTATGDSNAEHGGKSTSVDVDEYLRSRRSQRLGEDPSPFGYVRERTEKIQSRIKVLQDKISAFKDVESKAAEFVEQFIHGALPDEHVAWPSFQRSIGLREEPGWSQEAAKRYVKLIGIVGIRRHAQITPYVTAVGPEIQAKVQLQPGRDEVLNGDDASYWVFLRKNIAGELQVTGVSPEVFRVIGTIPESKYAILSAFRKLRLSILSHDTRQLASMIMPRPHSADEVSLSEELRPFLTALEGSGYAKLLTYGVVTAGGRDSTHAIVTLADDSMTGAIVLKLIGTRWYLKEILPPRIVGSRRKELRDTQ